MRMSITQIKQIFQRHFTNHWKTLFDGIVWLEVPIITLIAVALAISVNPSDPLTVKAIFPWIVLAPLLSALRYGFFWALISIIILYIAHHGTVTYLITMSVDIPSHWWLGILLVSLIAGEFRDLWFKKIANISRASQQYKHLLDQLNNAYQLIHHSHELLEKELTLRGPSLYSVLQSMAMLTKNKEPTLQAYAEELLDLISNYGQIHSATLLGINTCADNHSQFFQTWATVGNTAYLNQKDSLIDKALTNKCPVCIDPMYMRNDGANHTDLQACIPLMDCKGRTHALLAVYHMPFQHLNQVHLRNLGVIGCYATDLFTQNVETTEKVFKDDEVQQFDNTLHHCLKEMNIYNVNAALICIPMLTFKAATKLENQLKEALTSLDRFLYLPQIKDNKVNLLILKPLSKQIDITYFINDLCGNKQYNSALSRSHITHFLIAQREHMIRDLANFLKHCHYPQFSFLEAVNTQPPSLGIQQLQDKEILNNDQVVTSANCMDN